jgi:aldehyde:ferredoxin oxidoreductase
MDDRPSYGYHGAGLEVDLTARTSRVFPLDARLLGDYLGGRGLGARLLYDRIDPACDPLGPENEIIIAASPLVGTGGPTAGRGHMVFKSPLTGFIGSANCGGTWAPALKAAGLDVLILKGRASEPVWLDITPDGVAFHSAAGLWGLDTHETTDRLLADKTPGRVRKVLCIGPAGENLVRFAAVMNDKDRAYGRGGPGAVWGSKNLKAVRVAGDRKTSIKDPGLFQSGRDQAEYLLKQTPATKRILKDLGTAGLVNLINLIDMLPCRNFQGTRHGEEEIERVSGETLSKEILSRAGACYGCPIACQRHTVLGDGCKGEGPEYETTVLMGPNCGIYDLAAVTRANYRCNELGMDTISFGGTVACAMELFEKGYLPAPETGGLDLHFGQAAALEALTGLIAFRQGIGDRLAEGSYRLADGLNHPELAMTVKKLEIPGYDPRASFTQALGYMTSPTGACHLRGGYAVSLAFFGGFKEIPRFSLLQSPIAIRNMQNLGIIQDSLGVCRFTGYSFSYDPWARMVSGATGLDFPTIRLEETANRIATLERLFNLEAGLTPDDDLLPARFAEEPIRVEGQERAVTRESMLGMRADYYAARGWGPDGRPGPDLLAALRLEGRRRT